MDEPEPMREIHEIRERIHEETKDLSPEEYREWRERKNRERDMHLESIGLKLVPVEGTSHMRLVHI